MLHKFLASLFFTLSLALSASALSIEIPVTASNLDQSRYIFSVSTNAATNGIAFHVTITAKSDEIPSDSSAGLSIITHTRNSSGASTSISSAKPEIAITLNKQPRVWIADFTVTRATLKTPGLSFVFTEFAHATINGQTIAMPSADFYEIKLQDFSAP